MTPTETMATDAPAFRVVKREFGPRFWDVFSDEIGDYVATMCPALPVSSREVAERVCASLNERHALKNKVLS